MPSPPAASSCTIGVVPGRHPLFTVLRQLTRTMISQPAEDVAGMAAVVSTRRHGVTLES